MRIFAVDICKLKDTGIFMSDLYVCIYKVCSNISNTHLICIFK